MLKVGFAQNLFNLELEEVAGINWSEHHRCIGASAGTTDSNNILIGAHQTTVSRRHSYFTNNLHSLPEDTQDIGDYVPNNISIKFLAHGGTQSAEKVGGGKYYAALALNYFPVLLDEFLDIGSTESQVQQFIIAHSGFFV